MAVINVTLENTFEEWRVKTNQISTNLGDTALLISGDSNVVAAINTGRDFSIAMAIALG
jgi:hypothetical protein